jgi:hypothetical protein
MKLLKVLLISFLVLLLLFVIFRLITAPSPDAGIIEIIIASSLTDTTWDKRHRGRCFLRLRQRPG